MAHDPSQEGEVSETETINVVPLADLTLVLLVILMVISPMISQSMIHVSAPAVKADKDLTPQEQPPEDQKAPEPLMIGVTPAGYTLNNVPAPDLWALADAVAARLVEEPQRPVLVSADKAVTVGSVVEVLDTLKLKEPDVAQALGAADFKIKLSLLKKAEEAPAPAAAPAAKKGGKRR